MSDELNGKSFLRRQIMRVDDVLVVLKQLIEFVEDEIHWYETSESEFPRGKLDSKTRLNYIVNKLIYVKMLTKEVDEHESR